MAGWKEGEGGGADTGVEPYQEWLVEEGGGGAGKKKEKNLQERGGEAN